MTEFSDPTTATPGTDDQPAVQIHGIAKAFGDIQALDHVSFDVPAHSIFGLLGPNGAGKTTLFSVIANFLQEDDGHVEVLGINVRNISALKGRMTILPQDAEFQRNIPILDQLAFLRQLDGQDRATSEQEVQVTLQRVGLEDYAKRGVRALSHGMMKRLGIAQAFLGSPEVILLDEPTSGLDPANARQIRDLVRELQAQATVVISSHNLAEIQDLCDHVAILHKGKLVNAGSVEEITQADRQLEMRLSRQLEPAEIATLEALPGVNSVTDQNGAEYHVSLDLGTEAGRWDDVVGALLHSLLQCGAVPRELHEGQSLEKHFLNVTADGNAPEE